VTPLRWGLLGTARINRLIIPAVRLSSRSVVAAVASRDGSRAAGYAAEWNIPRAYASYDDLLSSDVDIVYLPLPNSLHAAWTLRALAAGKHVLCEKPLALTAADVTAVARTAALAGRVVAEGFMYRHHARTRRVQDLLADGAIGELRSIAGAFSYPRSRAADVRLDASLGGGVLWDVGCYPVSFAQMCAGAPPSRALGWQQVGDTGVDQQFAGTVVYANGVYAQIAASFTAAYDTFVRLTGTAGSIDIPRPFKPEPIDRLSLWRGGVLEDISVAGAPPFVDEVADMENAVLGIAPQRVTLAESALHAAALSALYTSARTGTAVDIGAAT
jgi:D-xylose 1-dehydrogenase (NADP+, D-xylono-1,5-lactone-forming)